MARPTKPVRLDVLLVKRGLAASRARARELIVEGAVQVDGIAADKPGRRVRPDQDIALGREDHHWVGRGALKLLGVLEPLGVRVQGRVAADLGASTGGFTQVLLEHGAERVYAVDVGKGQLAWSLRKDPRVVVMEGVNVRHLQSLPEPVSLVVGDLSFISLRTILPAVARLLAPGGQAVLMVKPQFEVGPERVEKGGVVRSPEARQDAIAGVASKAVELGLEILGGMDSPVAGARAGNVEHFLLLKSPC